MSTDKTLADVQPGGMVRLGDGVKECARRNCKERTGSANADCTGCGGTGYRRECNDPDCAEHGCCGYGKCYVSATDIALSAQPSPVDQDALVTALEVFERRRADIPYEVYEQVKAVCAVLAARRPVGQEPVAHEYTFAGLGKRDSVAFVGPEYKPAAPKGMQLVAVRPLYRQPAQAVDLGKIWQQAFNDTAHSYRRNKSRMWVLKILKERVQALIDRQEVGK